MTFRIVVADEMDVVTQGLRVILTEQQRYAVIAECHTLAAVQAVVRAQPVDVIICGQTLDPELDPLRLVDVLRQMVYRTRLILIGATANGLLIGTLLDLGLHGYLYKADSLRECLPLAVEMVTRSRTYLSPTADAEYVAALNRESAIRLNSQERTVLQLLAQGRKVAEIARLLQLPARRIYTIRDTLRNRFGATSNEHLLVRAIAEGFDCARE
ncbi:MAG: response regulator transcription factor [Anaerolinea sp.]|nr:response regulator transcription factor [Anaerolinea sp.]